MQFFLSHSFTMLTLIRWLTRQDRSETNNARPPWYFALSIRSVSSRTTVFRFPMAHNMEQFVTAAVRDNSLSLNAFKQTLKTRLFGNDEHHTASMWHFYDFGAARQSSRLAHLLRRWEFRSSCFIWCSPAFSTHAFWAFADSSVQPELDVLLFSWTVCW